MAKCGRDVRGHPQSASGPQEEIHRQRSCPKEHGKAEDFAVLISRAESISKNSISKCAILQKRKKFSCVQGLQELKYWRREKCQRQKVKTDTWGRARWWTNGLFFLAEKSGLDSIGWEAREEERGYHTRLWAAAGGLVQALDYLRKCTSIAKACRTCGFSPMRCQLAVTSAALVSA